MFTFFISESADGARFTNFRVHFVEADRAETWLTEIQLVFKRHNGNIIVHCERIQVRMNQNALHCHFPSTIREECCVDESGRVVGGFGSDDNQEIFRCDWP